MYSQYPNECTDGYNKGYYEGIKILNNDIELVCKEAQAKGFENGYTSSEYYKSLNKKEIHYNGKHSDRYKEEYYTYFNNGKQKLKDEIRQHSNNGYILGLFNRSFSPIAHSNKLVTDAFERSFKDGVDFYTNTLSTAPKLGENLLKFKKYAANNPRVKIGNSNV